MEENDPGPLDVVVLKFTGNEFTGEIAAVLRDLAIRDIVRVIDVLFVYKDGDGTTRSLELGALRPDLDPLFVDVDGQLGGGLLDAEDVDAVAAHLEPGASMAVVAVENVWAIPFIRAVRAAGGELLDQTRVPAEVLRAARRNAPT